MVGECGDGGAESLWVGARDGKFLETLAAIERDESRVAQHLVCVKDVVGGSRIGIVDNGGRDAWVRVELCQKVRLNCLAWLAPRGREFDQEPLLCGDECLERRVIRHHFGRCALSHTVFSPILGTVLAFCIFRTRHLCDVQARCCATFSPVTWRLDAMRLREPTAPGAQWHNESDTMMPTQVNARAACTKEGTAGSPSRPLGFFAYAGLAWLEHEKEARENETGNEGRDQEKRSRNRSRGADDDWSQRQG